MHGKNLTTQLRFQFNKAVVLVAALLLTVAVVPADVVSDWNAIPVDAVRGLDPVTESRIATITQLAVFEAVNAVTGDYKPYLGTIPSSPGASAQATAIAAAHVALRNYLPDKAATLDAARVKSLATIPDGPPKNAGIAVGEAAAAAMMACRANDGSEAPQFYLPTSSNPGEWQLTSGCPPQGGVLFHVRNVTPFSLRSADQFRSDPPPVLTSNKYARTDNEVKDVGALNSTERPPDGVNVVRFYAAVGAPAWGGVVARQLAVAQGRSLSQNARDFALFNMAIFDAGIAVVDTKYHYKFWPPETAIRASDSDGNARTDPDPSFAPFITTPCHPSYPSGHATTSYAAREVLERIYGPRGHPITLSSPRVEGVTLTYSSLKEITEDIDDARVFGGIHYRFDQEAGAEQGRRVGTYVYRNNLRRVQGCNCEEEEQPQ